MEKMNFLYDKRGDVLYISIGSPQKAISREMENDILLRMNPETSEIVGLTILNFTERFSDIENQQSFPVSAKFDIADDVKVLK